ncbi:hypothetical protein [Microseira sp. BLCC-F43]|uniref:hypothetical protein n=1 Tax=Microseira sp. BLCC-F43 TaxID=3153602 RepID=UPI0035B861B2
MPANRHRHYNLEIYRGLQPYDGDDGDDEDDGDNEVEVITSPSSSSSSFPVSLRPRVLSVIFFIPRVFVSPRP